MLPYAAADKALERKLKKQLQDDLRAKVTEPNFLPSRPFATQQEPKSGITHVSPTLENVAQQLEKLRDYENEQENFLVTS